MFVTRPFSRSLYFRYFTRYSDVFHFHVRVVCVILPLTKVQCLLVMVAGSFDRTEPDRRVFRDQSNETVRYSTNASESFTAVIRLHNYDVILRD